MSIFFITVHRIKNIGIKFSKSKGIITSTDREAKSSALFGSLLYIPVSLLFFFIGTALFSYYSAQPDLLPADLKLPGAGDKVFPCFVATGLPSGVTGLLIAAIFAAGMPGLFLPGFISKKTGKPEAIIGVIVGVIVIIWMSLSPLSVNAGGSWHSEVTFTPILL